MNRGDLQALCQIGKTINSILDYPRLLEKVMDLALETLGAERGAIILLGEDGTLENAVARNIQKKNLETLTNLSSSVVWRVIREKNPLLLHDVADDPVLKDAKSVISHNIQSVLCVPLTSRGKLLGAIYVDSLTSKGVFTSENLEFLTAFSDQAAVAIQNARYHNLLTEENRQLKEELKQDFGFTSIIGKSKPMQEVFGLLNKLLDSSVPVLISGETGTGKELVSRALHYNGARKDSRFVPVYCGSLPESLLESELFGYKKGAFTGAAHDKKGLFEEANQGTLFLDEVADIGLGIQAKLLRVLQEQEFYRIGDTNPRKVNVRIISATNKDLEAEIEAKRFRGDLYYRLNVVSVKLPPLRERSGDVTLLAHHFLNRYAADAGKNIKGFSPGALRALETYSWPGNVRELENLIARCVALSEDKLLSQDVLGLSETHVIPDKPLKERIREFEREYIKTALKECNGNRRKAARRLGISLRSLQYKIKDTPDAEKV
ncbi:sigma-54-dependent Fis family transcriptional regulator [candidate division WOR-3 bacterium]|nr:sigma-54-dependent Fis family transcriptional regulator [candidate division WOR-3 bacterium]